MKKNYRILLALSISAFLFLNSCSKKSDDPSPSSGNGGGSGHISGSTEGTVTIDGTTTTISGSSTNSQYGFVMTPRNMTPANSYPAFNVNFAARPARDSTYTITSSNSVILYLGNTNSNNDNYYNFSGTIVVDVVGTDHITATVSNLTMTNAASQSKTVSASVTYYY